jgi:hypothetical protein
MFAVAGGDHFHLPALRRGIALIHPEQVAREDRRLVAAGSGAHFENRVLVVGGILGQQQDADVMLHLLDLCVEVRPLGFRHVRHLAARLDHVGQVAALVIGLLQHPRRLGCGLQVGIFLGHLHEGFARSP